MSHRFQRSPLSPFSNPTARPLSTYPSPIPSHAPHARHSDLLYLQFTESTHTLSALGSGHCLHLELSVPSHGMYLEHKCSLFFKIHFTVAFFLKPFSVPYYYLLDFAQHLYLLSIIALNYGDYILLFHLTVNCIILNPVTSALGLI